MNTEKRDFDKEAASWDEHPPRVKLANDVVRAISNHIVMTSDMDVMDFGCGLCASTCPSNVINYPA